MVKRTAGEWIGFALLVPIVTILSFVFHELAHYFAGEVQGLDMWFNLNFAGYQAGVQPTPTQITIVTMAGPVFTIAQAIVAAVLIRSRAYLWLYSVVIVALYQRAVAFGISMVNYPNDEARISVMYGWSIWFLPSIVVGLLLLVTVWAAFKARAGLRANIIAYVMCSAATAAVVFGNDAFPVRLG